MSSNIMFSSYENPVVVSDDIKLLQNVNRLTSSHVLYKQDNFVAFFAKASEIPYILNEIGRLREITFREIGEGTGMECDLDCFDQDYHHLFLWCKLSNKIIGAYRLGLVDVILESKGINGLYLSSQYDVNYDFFAALNPIIELGRTFIVKEYQNHPLALTVLWRALGKFISLHPKYRGFYGVTSISNQYTLFSRQLITYFLQQNKFNFELANLISAKNPFVISNEKELILELQNKLSGVKNIFHLDVLVSEYEFDGKGLPTLFQLYDSLGVTFCGFSIDPSFSNVLDCLGVCFIRNIPFRKLIYFMGKENAANYCKHHF